MASMNVADAFKPVCSAHASLNETMTEKEHWHSCRYVPGGGGTWSADKTEGKVLSLILAFVCFTVLKCFNGAWHITDINVHNKFKYRCLAANARKS